MPKAITAIIIPDAEAWLRENIENLPIDSVCAIQRTSKWKLDGETYFADQEQGGDKGLVLGDFVQALQKLADQIGQQRLFVGGLKSPTDLMDPCNWDVEVTDALRQLAYHGAVIYG